jgi:hypothetical protein
MRARGVVIFAQSPLLAELDRLGIYGVEALDTNRGLPRTTRPSANASLSNRAA